MESLLVVVVEVTVEAHVGAVGGEVGGDVKNEIETEIEENGALVCGTWAAGRAAFLPPVVQPDF